ncbi:MAG: GTP-binding protein [Candidatus Izemoplasmatales bacterium]|jgi:elongation factor G|nr:GTP-binding protein [Candidatus Izemoplasmatales bacterium]
MNEYKADALRNVILLGHLGSGKTSLAESLAYIAGAIDKKGTIEKKSTVSDYTPEEQNKLSSLSTGLLPIEFKDMKVNILDAPGADEMIGDISHSLAVANAAVLVVDASSGVEVGTEKMWLEIKKRNLPAIIFLNKMDKENIKFEEVLEEIRTKLGKQAVPFCLPLGKSDDFNGFADIVELKARIYDGNACIDGEIYPDKMDKVESLRQDLIETVAGSDEELLEKYFEGEELTMDEIRTGLHKSVLNGEAVPVMVGSGLKDVGTLTLLHMIRQYFPSVAEGKGIVGKNEKDVEVTRNYKDEEPFSAFVFKTLIDPFVGTINIMQIKSGTLHKDQEVYVSSKEGTEKASQVFTLLGKNQIAMDVFHAGDICAMAKVADVKTGSTLSEKKNIVIYPEIASPTPTMYVAIKPENKKDEDKLSNALAKLQLEDNTLEVVRNKETSQLLIGGQGMIHLGYIIDKMKNMFKVALQSEDQRIVYRETIKQTATAEGRYIKQSGGSGYYGVVVMRFEPTDAEYEFSEEIFG